MALDTAAQILVGAAASGAAVYGVVIARRARKDQQRLQARLEAVDVRLRVEEIWKERGPDSGQFSCVPWVVAVNHGLSPVWITAMGIHTEPGGLGVGIDDRTEGIWRKLEPGQPERFEVDDRLVSQFITRKGFYGYAELATGESFESERFVPDPQVLGRHASNP